MRRLACRLDGGKKKADKDGDDRDDNEQLDEGEPARIIPKLDRFVHEETPWKKVERTSYNRDGNILN